MSDKAARMLRLVQKRRNVVWPGYTGVADYHGGAYDADFVCPYSKSACNLDARVMILLQDWISHDAISRPPDDDMVQYGQLPHLPTNRDLKRRLQEAFGLSLADTYATDLFPFVKPGGMSTAIPAGYLRRAAREYAVPQIEIVARELVVCIGLATFNALREACGLRAVRRLDDAISQPFGWGRSRMWCQAHTGAMGFNMRCRGDRQRVSRDWAVMQVRSDGRVERAGRAVDDCSCREKHAQIRCERRPYRRVDLIARYEEASPPHADAIPGLRPADV